MDQLPTQSVWYEVEEGVTQQSTWGEAEQHLEQVLVLVTVGLNWDQKQDEERSRTDQQGRSDSLWTGMERSLLFLSVPRDRMLSNCKIINNVVDDEGKTGIKGEKERKGTAICVEANPGKACRMSLDL